MYKTVVLSRAEETAHVHEEVSEVPLETGRVLVGHCGGEVIGRHEPVERVDEPLQPHRVVLLTGKEMLHQCPVFILLAQRLRRGFVVWRNLRKRHMQGRRQVEGSTRKGANLRTRGSTTTVQHELGEQHRKTDRDKHSTYT